MKVLVEYNQASGMVNINGIDYYTMPNLPVAEYIDSNSEILDLVKQGLTAEDLINLRKQDLI